MKNERRQKKWRKNVCDDGKWEKGKLKELTEKEKKKKKKMGKDIYNI